VPYVLIRFIYMTLFCVLLTACASHRTEAPPSKEEKLAIKDAAIIHRSGLPGVLVSRYARVVRTSEQSFYQAQTISIEPGPHRVQIECKVCDVQLLLFKNCNIYLSDFLPVRLQPNTEYIAKCDRNLEHDNIEFWLQQKDNDHIEAQQTKTYDLP
jgi:hypothetical protein